MGLAARYYLLTVNLDRNLAEDQIMDAITTRANNFAEMAYVGETPWHGLGQRLEAGLSIDEWKVQAGMDWQVLRAPVQYAPVGGNVLTMPEQHVVFRSDSNKPLGVVSSKYKVVQPGEVLEFFRDLTGAAGFELNTAGTLFDGRRFWALAEIGESAVIVGDDKVDGYLLLSSSCDGTLATTAQFTTVRVVCNNTLSMALNAKGRRHVTVRHSTHFDRNAVKAKLGIAHDSFGDFIKAARTLAAKKVDNEKAEQFIAKLLTETKTVYKEDPTTSRQFTRIMDLFRGSAMGGTLVSAEGTAWGMVNAVTEFVDHHARAQSTNNRLASAWFGRGDELKTEALERALAL